MFDSPSYLSNTGLVPLTAEAHVLTSKEVLEKTGISRATLNNYISWGIVPRPEVLPPAPDDGAAPRIGYFQPGVIARIEEIQRLKREGWSISRITERFGVPGGCRPEPARRPRPGATNRAAPRCPRSRWARSTSPPTSSTTGSRWCGSTPPPARRPGPTWRPCPRAPCLAACSSTLPDRAGATAPTRGRATPSCDCTSASRASGARAWRMSVGTWRLPTCRCWRACTATRSRSTSRWWSACRSPPNAPVRTAPSCMP